LTSRRRRRSPARRHAQRGRYGSRDQGGKDGKEGERDGDGTHKEEEDDERRGEPGEEIMAV
jgi:hypothetical protein